jgi:hypothetical protein
MPIEGSSIQPDATPAASGGTDTDLKLKDRGQGYVNMILDDGSEFINQVTFTFSFKDPKVSASAPNGYTQARTSVVMRSPLALDNGEYTVNTGRIELAVDHETTNSEVQTMLNCMGQLLCDSDFTEAWAEQLSA